MGARSHLRRLAALAAALALAAGTAACGSASDGASAPASAAASGPASAPARAPGQLAANAPADSLDRIPDLVEAIQPSIVTVFAQRADGSGTAGQSVGSGVIYRADGIILTNQHVVAGASKVEVALADGARVAGRVVAADADTDLAVIRIDRRNLPAAAFQTALPRVGSLAVVLGSPLGFEKTVTAGIVSGLHRQIPGSASETRALVDLIQTDAAISPGNSGGAIVGPDGRVVGISVAYVPPQQGAVAVGFAIPAATATRVADELLAHGRARHAYLGLQPGELTPQIAEELQVRRDGVVVYAVASGGPAATAGLRPGDVLTSVAGQKVTTVEELFAALRAHEPGESVSIAYVRDGHDQTVRLQISDRPA
jgi:S1-C subfamily serine protease